jgi:hypothetical protein
MAGDDYFRAAELTRQLVAALEAFVRGEKSSAELEAWAHGVWPSTGTQEGPIASNALATRMLINAWNADVREGQIPLLRIDDALAYLSTLRRGVGKATPRLIGNAVAPFEQLTQKLAVPTERHVVDGLGWFEFAQFASPATGRSFLLDVPLQTASIGFDDTHRVASFYAEALGEPRDCLVDLLETLSLDLSDLSWRAEPFDAISLPEWALWRQDDNGIKTHVSSFTGRCKARAALASFEALHHKQTYWLEGPV